MKNVRKIILVMLLTLPSLSFGESSVFALMPKSIGEYHYPFSTAALGRGGFEIAFLDSVNINQMNYSIWAFIPRTTLSIGLAYQRLSSESKINHINSFNGNFLGGFLAIPIVRRKMAIGFGVLPVTLNNQRFILKDVGVGASADQTIKTDGTLSEVQAIVSYAPSKNLSFGIFMYYILGKIIDDFQIEYKDRTYGDILIQNQYHFYGKRPSIGVSAFYRLTENVAIGGRIKLPAVIKVYAQQESITSNTTIEKYQDVTFPINWSTGLVWQPGERWAIGGDFDYIAWKNGYLFDGLTVSDMNNNYRLGVGVEYKPSTRRIISYADKMNYRAGIFYGQLNFLSNNQAVNEYGFSLGLGLPITRGNSRLDVAFQVGKRGDINTNGLSEMFFRFNFSLAANELWFIRDEQ